MSQSAGQRVLINAMSELIMEEPDFLEHGIPPDRLFEVIMSKESILLSKKFLEGVIQKELDNGRLTKMSNGNYCLSSGDGDKEDSPDNSSSNQDISSYPSSPRYGKTKSGRKKMEINSSQEEKNISTIRVGERRKRAKKVFDPSDNNLPSKKRRAQKIANATGVKINNKKNNFPSTSSKQINNLTQKSKSESADSTDEEQHDNANFAPDMNDKIIGGVCSVCRQYQNSKDTHGKLIECKDCSNKAHPSCLRGDGMLRMRPDNTWQCPHCKTCVICIETNDAGVLTVCNVCADAYHALCHSPPIPEKLKAWDQWECRNCIETQNSGSNIDTSYIEKLPSSDRSSKYSDQSDSRKSSVDRKREKSSAKSVDSDEKNDFKTSDKDDHSISPNSLDKSEWQYSRKLVSPVTQNSVDYKPEQNGKHNKTSETKYKRGHRKPNSEQKMKVDVDSVFMSNHSYLKLCSNDVFKKHPKDKEDGNIDLSIPDAEKWTFHDVYQYFMPYFPEQAHIFKEQEIDGKSLLLLRRHDVISNFDIPLGFALKIYRHIVKLQSRRDDFTMCWL